MKMTRRDVLRMGALGTMGIAANDMLGRAAAAAPEAGAPAPRHGWLNRRQRIYWYDQYALNEQETAFANYDPDRIAAELKATGADIVAVYAANQFSVAYYPSAIWPVHPNLKGRDYFGEVTSRLKAQGQKVIGYINWLESRRPEWWMVPLGGAPQKEYPPASWADPDDPDRRAQRVPGGAWRFACLNSPRRDQVVAVAREIVEGYHPDGFHLDMCFNSEVCVCPYCRPTLEGICGTKDITLEAVHAHWREFVDWRNERAASLIGEVSAVLREHGVFAAHNGQNPLWLSPIYGFDRNLVPHLDLYLSEIFYDLNTAGLTMRWHRALGMPSCMLLTSTAPMHAHLSVPPASWRASAAAAKANGCPILGPCGVGAHPDTTSSKRLLETVRGGLDFFMEDADLHDGAAPASKIGLVFSWATRKYFRQGRLDWSHELDGWSRVLLEEHLPFDVVIAEDVRGAEDLARYDLVILPNTSFVDDTFCAAVEGYVRAGGRVLGTGEVGLGDARGFDRPDFALGGLFGVARKGADQGDFALEGPVEPEPANGVFQWVEAAEGVLARRVATDPAGPVAGGPDPLAVGPPEAPAVVLRGAGAGQAMYIAFGIGRYYVSGTFPHARDRMAKCLDLLLPARQITVDAPRCVEVTVWRQETPERTIIHLANRTPLAHDMPRIHEIPPLRDVTVEFENPYRNSKVSCRGASVTTALEAGRVRASIDSLDVYAAVVIEPA